MRTQIERKTHDPNPSKIDSFWGFCWKTEFLSMGVAGEDDADRKVSCYHQGGLPRNRAAREKFRYKKRTPVTAVEFLESAVPEATHWSEASWKWILSL